MRKSMWLGVLAIVAIGGYLLHADDPKPGAPKEGGEFAGKIVYVQTRGGPKGLAIAEPKVHVLGGRPFLVGKATGDDAVSWKPYFSGADVWLPIDEIEGLSTFEGVPQLKRAAGQ